MIPEIKISISFDKKIKQKNLLRVTSSSECYKFLKPLFDEDVFFWKEEMILLCLNTYGAIIGFYKISSGGIDSTLVDVRIIFTIALNCPSTTRIIIAHNHPSGNLKPSTPDINMTRKIKNAGELLEIKLLDSMIVTEDGYFSFADDGIL